MNPQKKYLAIHGHFYQPPRENPWTGLIEVQKSADPFHDWNERIFSECYGPNAYSRILDSKGKIEEMVNNYEYMSFNIGPTLMKWIKEHSNSTFLKIVDADRKSAQRLNGHGNAIAQVYNHIIMPLASHKDRLTQIRWGVRDFENNFGRKPESIWLAETGIDMKTVVDLIKEGITYVILSPTQAHSIRKLDGSGDWHNVEDHSIDSTQSYRIIPRSSNGELLCEGHLDVFFYHKGLSTAVSFESLLKDASHYGNRIRYSFDELIEHPQLVSIATDGESYGHHEKFGDMCVAYLFRRILPTCDIDVVNYGWFLEEHPPVYEVRLKNAYENGTAWSCAHGVGRWFRDCGCQTGGPDTWNQRWRGPLRDALNYLKSEADSVFEREMALLSSTSPWEIRDDYIEYINATTETEKENFLNKYLKTRTHETESAFLRLLEMQKYALYSFTSCGWFFNDIDGIEPIQNMQYARIVLDLMKTFGKIDKVESLFKETLSMAKSNLSALTGKEIFEQQASPKRDVSFQTVAGLYFRNEINGKELAAETPQYSVKSRKVGSVGETSEWRVSYDDKTTKVHKTFYVLALPMVNNPPVLVYSDNTFALNQRVDEFNLKSLSEIRQVFAGSTVLEAKDMLPDDIQAIAEEIAWDVLDGLHALEKDRKNFVFHCFEHQCIPATKKVQFPLKVVLLSELNLVMNNLLESNNISDFNRLVKLSSIARTIGVEYSNPLITQRINKKINFLLSEFENTSEFNLIQDVIQIIIVAKIVNININRVEYENLIFMANQKTKNVKLDEMLLLLQSYPGQ